ncbi:hypothetical protein [Helicobacter burdigaliensis]|uniref:hypothetical protein n=1 Tax=Helicobacter burdigaliensis TaxID=2315334 RepID=UPI000EF74BA8|nr:hypothetical protein [Helicobacter burdigaliensis]
MQRDVFYIPGYDPRGRRHYYSLLKENLQKQNKINGLNLEISPLKKSKLPYCEIYQKEAKTHYYFLEWDSIIRAHWARNSLQYLKEFLYFLKVYVFSSLFMKFAKASKTQLIAGLYPVLYFTFMQIFGIFLVLLSLIILADFGSLFLGLGVVFGIIFLKFWNDFVIFCGKKLAVFWLSNIYVFCAKFAKGKIKDLNAKESEFAQEIVEILELNHQNKNYEMLIISHSVGTILSIGVVFRVIELAKKRNLNLANLKLVTLGECIPLASFQKDNEAFIGQLRGIIEAKLVWIDITSPIDGACFPLLDFVTIAGIKKDKFPYFKNARFFTLFSKETYKNIRKNRYLAHFLYLYANEILGEYDYFSLIGSKDFLENKFKE